jgi:ribosomal protein S14
LLMVGRRQRDCAGCGAPVGYLGREYCCLCMRPDPREDAAEGVLPGLRQGPCAELRTPGGAGCVPGAARNGVEGESAGSGAGT